MQSGAKASLRQDKLLVTAKIGGGVGLWALFFFFSLIMKVSKYEVKLKESYMFKLKSFKIRPSEVFSCERLRCWGQRWGQKSLFDKLLFDG